ncbi:MAG: AMP-binding protein, partial [Acidimicrobiia bacterium]|nr:AMP-binding protein [Acidimicrobiia bacterium]
MRDSVSITELTPLLLLERSADVFPDRTAVVYGDTRMTYSEMRSETNRLADALATSGVGPGDRVGWLMPNLPQTLLAHFAVPLLHAVLVAINTRLAGPEIQYILGHSKGDATRVNPDRSAELEAQVPVSVPRSCPVVCEPGAPTLDGVSAATGSVNSKQVHPS